MDSWLVVLGGVPSGGSTLSLSNDDELFIQLEVWRKIVINFEFLNDGGFLFVYENFVTKN